MHCGYSWSRPFPALTPHPPPDPAWASGSPHSLSSEIPESAAQTFQSFRDSASAELFLLPP